MNSIIEIQNLSIKFEKENSTIDAVKNISFSIPKNNITAIVGESGSGKTLTAFSILKLLPPKTTIEGEVFYHDELNNKRDLLAIAEKEITPIRGKEISMIFQEPMTALNPLIKCGIQVMEVMLTHQIISKKEAKEKTILLLKQVELKDAESIFKKYPHELSGGQRQRIMIAMAVCCNPSLLIADEPTTALDVRTQQSIMKLLKKFQHQNNMSILLITHDLGLAADFADDIMVMRKGEIVETGSPKKLFYSPEHAYTKALLACRPSVNKKDFPLPVFEDFLNNKINNSKIHFNKDLRISGTQKKELLSVVDLTVEFPSKKNIWGNPCAFQKAIDCINFKVYENETVGIVGESGCGKTTLARVILQLTNPSSGSILFHGNNIFDKHKNNVSKKELQIVFQDPFSSLNPTISIGEAIAEPLKTFKIISQHKQRKERVMELLKMVGLQTDHYNKFPHQFSGGQRQRICIARALAIEPSLMIFDESVSALDVNIQAQILNLINELKAAHCFTSIFISHDLSVVHYISDKILVMKNGKIVEEGLSNDLMLNPQHHYTKELISATPGKMFRNEV